MAISAPRQDRSRVTLARLLDAAEALLQTKTFDEIAIQEIVAAADSSIGSFYARFSDKESLRECLIDRYHDGLLQATEELLDAREWEGRGLADRAETLVRGIAAACIRRRGLMRMRVLHFAIHPDAVAEHHLEKTTAFVARLEAFLAPCLHEITHPRPEVALPFALRFIDSVIASTLLFDRQTGTSYQDIAFSTLVQETTRAFLAYLGACRPGAP